MVDELISRCELSKRGRRFLSYLGIGRYREISDLLPSWKRSEHYSQLSPHPIHAPKVGTMSEQLFIDIANSCMDDHKKDSLSYLKDPSKYPDIPPELLSSMFTRPASTLTASEFALMVENQILESTVFDTGDHFGYLFTVEEAHKQRRRVVHDTISVNTLCDKPPRLAFTDLNVLKRRVFSGSSAVTFDVKCMYYQIPLHPAVRGFFKIGLGDRIFQCCRLPMGFTWAAVIAQTIMEYICSVVTSSCNVTSEVYIDNVMFIGCPDACSRAREKFLSLCDYYNITLGEIGEVGPRCIFRGMNFDFEHKTVSISDKFLSKFIQRLNSATSQWADWRALISSLIYSFGMVQGKMSEIFHLLKFVARHAGTKPRDNVTLWAEAKREWDYAVQHVLKNTPLHVISPQQSIAVVTDAATETGLGAYVIVTSRGRLIVKSFPITDYESINDMEGEALLYCCRDQPSILNYRIIEYYGDNTSLLHCLRSDHAKSFRLNLVVGKIHGRLHALKSRLNLHWIPSLFNPADAPSRGKKISDDKHLTALRYIRKRSGTAPWLYSCNDVFESSKGVE